MKPFRYFAPGLVNQLDERFEEGYNPLIILNKTLSEEERKYLAKKNEQTGLVGKLDIGMLKEETDYHNILAQTKDLPLEKEVECKLPSFIAHQEGKHVTSTFGAKEYLTFIQKTKELIDRVAETIAEFDYTLTAENRPRFNFGMTQNPAEGDQHPRWKGKWSAKPVLVGTAFCSAQEINHYLKQTKLAGLELDLEHLTQTTQWHHIFNLEAGEKIRIGDLPTQEQAILQMYCIGEREEQILWDYTQMTDEEHQLLEQVGFTIRKGQPLLYAQKSTLQQELDLLAPLPISSITPGFQVWQGYQDQRTLHIASHTPGLEFPDDILPKWEAELKAVYKACFERIKSNSIVLEPVITDEQGAVYMGADWTEGMRKTKKDFKRIYTERNDEQRPLYY